MQDIKPGFKTSEFLAAMVAAIGSLLTVLVVVGWVTAEQAETINEAVAQLVVAAPVVIGAFAMIWKVIGSYIQSRTDVKKAAIINK